MSSGNIHNLRPNLKSKGFHLYKGDFAERGILRSVLPATDVVVHLAALTSVPYSVLHPGITRRVNAERTATLLSACARYSVGRFVLASTAAVYGRRPPPLVETMTPDPLSPYAASKVSAEASVRSHTSPSGLESVILRFMNVYGTGCSASSEGVIPSFLRAVREEAPLVLYGRGSQSRDFVHVSDVVDSITLAIHTSACQAEVFNIGTGRPTTIKGLVDLFRDLLPSKGIRVKHLPPRTGDVKQSYADVSKAARVLGFTSHVKLRAGLADLFKREKLV